MYGPIANMTSQTGSFRLISDLGIPQLGGPI